MSWLVTARTHAEVRDAIEQRLQDTANAAWTAAEIDQYIKDALTEISNWVPYRVKDESLTFASATRELDISAVKDISRIIKAEWIVDQEPPNFRNITWLDQHTIKIMVEGVPDSGAACYLYLDKRHHLDPIWLVATAYVKGDFVSPTKANRTGYRYECTTAGTSHATTEPTWGTTVGGTTAGNGTLVFTCRGEVPNSLKDGDNDLEDVLIDIVVGEALDNKGLGKINTINVGSARALEQYLATANRRRLIARDKLVRLRKPQVTQWYPTA